MSYLFCFVFFEEINKMLLRRFTCEDCQSSTICAFSESSKKPKRWLMVYCGFLIILRTVLSKEYRREKTFSQSVFKRVVLCSVKIWGCVSTVDQFVFNLSLPTTSFFIISSFLLDSTSLLTAPFTTVVHLQLPSIQPSF